MATYAIGDIHGCLWALKTLFASIDFKPEDTIVCLGDYVDRGPDSKGVIDYLLAKEREHKMVFIKGNHDIMMESARTNADEYSRWTWFGGIQTLQSYGLAKESPWWVEKVPDLHWYFLDNALPHYELGQYIFVHAGLQAGISVAMQSTDALFWYKYEQPDAYSPDRTVICGHTSRKNGRIANFGHTVCIDTYCYGGQWLTCLNVETGEFWQANDACQLQTRQL